MVPPYRRRLGNTADRAIGLLAPMALFLEVGSPILLASSPIGREGLAIPLSLLMLPLALLIGFGHLPKNPSPRQVALLLAATPFVVVTIAIAGTESLYGAPEAAAFGVQWILVFLWLPYFVTLDQRRLRNLLRGFTFGASFTVAYYGLAVGVEFWRYGALQDAGRMTQNLVFPGQYQIAVYVPTLIAYSTAFVTLLHVAHIERRSAASIAILNASALLVLVALAAREALLVYLVAITSLALVGRPLRVLLTGTVCTLLVSLVVVNWESIGSVLAEFESRALTKIVVDLSDADRRFAGRDAMIAETWTVFVADPALGSRFRPPPMVGRELGVTAPSAHNMYVDAFVWSGVMGGAPFVLFCAFLGLAAARVVSGTPTGIGRPKLRNGVAILVLLILLLSNNVNVPMRQPVLAPSIAMLISVLVVHRDMDMI